jgi:hypothetical protein
MRLRLNDEWMSAINADAARNVQRNRPDNLSDADMRLASASFAAGFTRGVATAVAASGRG